MKDAKPSRAPVPQPPTCMHWAAAARARLSLHQSQGAACNQSRARERVHRSLRAISAADTGPRQPSQRQRTACRPICGEKVSAEPAPPKRCRMRHNASRRSRSDCRTWSPCAIAAGAPHQRSATTARIRAATSPCAPGPRVVGTFSGGGLRRLEHGGRPASEPARPAWLRLEPAACRSLAAAGCSAYLARAGGLIAGAAPSSGRSAELRRLRRPQGTDRDPRRARTVPPRCRLGC